MKHQKLTQERLRKLLHYDPITGIFTWLVSNSNRINVGDIAGCIYDKGYREIGIDGKIYKASRLAWLYMDGYFPEADVDHVNRNKDDNRWSNLRHVSRICSIRNRGIQKNNSSDVTGIRWNKQMGKWQAQITVNKKQIHLGFFNIKREAVKIRLEAEIKFNFPNCNSTSSAYLYLKKNIEINS